ncbi:NAD(P)/FAD-dependent oxidoreductase [Thalassobacillus devorans]|uniref:NAD(P)/FAD-dependent oxidoreductase n=1 Tax=Thalassobacillus devorans TaxID=279813 RepID=UPI00048C2086|nr:FAD-binding oxidoreductase [Thalassobacillus devorans]
MSSYIVVGAGILGASTAYHLAKSGAKVTLIDRGEPGQATDAAAGIVCPWLSQRRNKKWYRLAKGGARYYPDLIDKLKEDGETETGYKKVGAISLHTDEDKLEKMEQRAYKRREDAPEIGTITRMSPEETRALFPPLAPEYGSVHVSGGARVNGKAIRQALIRAAEKNGTDLHHSHASLIHEGNRVIGAETEEHRLLADKVIVTAGAWGGELFRPLGLSLHITSQRAQIAHVELPGEDTSTWPVVMPPTPQYMLAFENGRIVVGATHDDGVGFDHRVTAGGLHEIFDKALKVAPGLGDSTMLEAKAGFRPFTPGFLPVFGEIPGFEGVLMANGLGASGLTVGPYLGAELARMALGEKTELDPAEYDVSEAIKKDNYR